MQAEKVRNPQVTMARTPADAWQSRSAIGSTDGVTTYPERGLMRLGHGGALLLSRLYHEPTAGRADHGDQHPEAKCPTKSTVCKSLVQERDEDPDASQPQDADRRTHGAP